MAGLGGFGWGYRSMYQSMARFWLWVGIAAVLSGAALVAQDGEAMHTLHVYANTIQVPVLVLGPRRERLTAPIAANRFSISVDAGPWFRATHVRQEGEDPISLAIVLDVSGYVTEMMPKMDAEIASLAPEGLHARDRVSVYAVDCSLINSVSDGAPDAAGLKRSVDLALESWTKRRANKHARPCRQTVALWDSLTLVTEALSTKPGRRVILVVSDGKDRGSRRTWNEVRSYAQESGVAIFGVTWIPEIMAQNPLIGRWGAENGFNSLCELSGGMLQLTSAEMMEEKIKRVVEMVRERYIVEFPRPANGTAGRHGLMVRVEKSDDFIRPAGVLFTTVDPALLADPTTVPSDPSRTPTQGKHRILAPPK